MADAELRRAARDLLVRYGGDAFPTLFVSAKGSTVRDDEGREILDFPPSATIIPPSSPPSRTAPIAPCTCSPA